MLTYHTMDKRGWARGPWDNEPDKLQWTDETTGYPCLVVRGRHGALCGYVGVDARHPWFKCGYDEAFGDAGDWGSTPDGRIEVHGGLTYSDLCQEGDEATSICHIPVPGQPDHVWWFGFDCIHGGDLGPAWGGHPGDTYKDLDYVREQIGNLARQLRAIAD